MLVSSCLYWYYTEFIHSLVCCLCQIMGPDCVAMCDRCCSYIRSATWTMVWWWLALVAQARALHGKSFWKLLNAMRASRVSPMLLIPKPFPKRHCTEFLTLTPENGQMVCLRTFWGKERYLCFVCKNLYSVTFTSFLYDSLGIDTARGSKVVSLLLCLHICSLNYPKVCYFKLGPIHPVLLY